MLLGIVVHGALFAQAVVEAPPKIEFGPWNPIPTEDEDLGEYDVTFPSAYSTGIPENDLVPVRVFVPKQGKQPYPVVVVLHYWGAGDQKIERSLAGDLARQGIASALVTLPYHLTRAPKGTRSGELAIRPDPQSMIANLTQGVLDVRRAIDFLTSRPEFDPDRIGIAGTSLGSIVSSLTYAVEPRLKASAFMLGGVDLAHIFWHSSRVVAVRDALRNKGFTEARLREALTEVEPSRYLANRTTGASFVIGGRFDTVMPPPDTQKLIDALPGSKSLWLDTGHYGGVFVQRRVLRLVSQFFKDQFSGSTFTPPKSIYAPTIRILVEANFESSFQIGIGLDLWRANGRGDFFSTAIATPRGPQLFLGGKLDKGLAIGLFATPKRITPGLIWSFVL